MRPPLLASTAGRLAAVAVGETADQSAAHSQNLTAPWWGRGPERVMRMGMRQTLSVVGSAKISVDNKKKNCLQFSPVILSVLEL